MANRRLAIDLSAVRLGGGVSRAKELAASFSALAPDVDYVFALSRAMHEQLPLLPPRARCIHVPGRLEPRPLRMLWEHARLPSLLARERPDWVFSPVGVLPLGPGLGVTRRAVIVSSIAPFHAQLLATLSPAGRLRTTVLRDLMHRSIEAADHVFLLSQEAHRLLRNRLEGKPTTFLPMSPPPPATLAAAETADLPAEATRRPYFLVAGDLWRYRAAAEGIRGALALQDQGVDVSLLVCGSNSEASYSAELRALASRSRDARIVLLGSRPQSEVLALMRGSVATIVCSRVENVSRVPIEAMAMGTAVIAVDLPPSWENCGEGARYYPAGDIDALATAMREVLESPSARSELVRSGQRYLSDRDWMSASRTVLATLGFIGHATESVAGRDDRPPPS